MQIETWGEEKFSALLFTNKVLRATCGDQERHAEAASALSDSSPKSPASSFLQASKLFLESTKRNLLQEGKKKKKSFSDKQEEIQNLLKKSKAKIYESKTQAHVLNKGRPFQLGRGRKSCSLTTGTNCVKVQEVTRLEMMGRDLEKGSHCPALTDDVLRKHGPSAVNIAVFKETLESLDFLWNLPPFKFSQLLLFCQANSMGFQVPLSTYRMEGCWDHLKYLSLVCKRGIPREGRERPQDKQEDSRRRATVAS